MQIRQHLFSPWVDHLLPWLSFLALLATGAFEAFELIAMGVPLLSAAMAQSSKRDLSSYRKRLEWLALILLALMLFSGMGLVPVTIILIFMLCSVRLSLPRELSQQRQLLLMSFLLFLVTSIATVEWFFLPFLVIYGLLSCVILMLINDRATQIRLGRNQPLEATPGRPLLIWLIMASFIGIILFAMVPRYRLGMGFLPWRSGLAGSVSGLSDKLELDNSGPISQSGEVVMRIFPRHEDQRSEIQENFALLRTLVLERYSRSRWEVDENTPFVRDIDFDMNHFRRIPGRLESEFFLSPSPTGYIPLPYGRVILQGSMRYFAESNVGSSLRWRFPMRRAFNIQVDLEPGTRMELKAAPIQYVSYASSEPVTPARQAAMNWSLRVAPRTTSATALAQKLEADLTTFTYTLENPSGKASDPMQDFLERTKAGHCEYFASALALALRERGFPSRVINGYRLGAWIPEGGYWVVTQDEAHSWVEYFDREMGEWKISDPTPPAPPGRFEKKTFWAQIQRWRDTAKFNWDRYVVRYSLSDQQATLKWVQKKVAQWQFSFSLEKSVQQLKNLNTRSLLLSLLVAVLLGLSFWRLFRWTRDHSQRQVHLPELRPLVQKCQKWAPLEKGESARQYLERLARLRPDVAQELKELADLCDAAAYGNASRKPLKTRVQKVLKQLKPHVNQQSPRK